MSALDELFGLAGQMAVVTGAGRGIGKGGGAAVVCAARRAHEIGAVARRIVAAAGKAIAVPTDVRDDAALERLAERAVAEFGLCVASPAAEWVTGQCIRVTGGA